MSEGIDEREDDRVLDKAQECETQADSNDASATSTSVQATRYSMTRVTAKLPKPHSASNRLPSKGEK